MSGYLTVEQLGEWAERYKDTPWNMLALATAADKQPGPVAVMRSLFHHALPSAEVVPLRLVIDMQEARKAYADYAADCAWYLERGELTPDHPDIGYRTGTPPPFEEYLEGWTAGILGDALQSHYGWRIEKA